MLLALLVLAPSMLAIAPPATALGKHVCVSIDRDFDVRVEVRDEECSTPFRCASADLAPVEDSSVCVRHDDAAGGGGPLPRRLVALHVEP